MSKVKGDKKAQNAVSMAKPLSTVKEGRVTKLSQTTKAKAKEIAKKAASKHDKKEKEEVKQMIKEPTKESDESASDDEDDTDMSDSDASHSESDEKNTNGKAASVSSDSEDDIDEDSDESSESESEVEVKLDWGTKVNGNNDDVSETSDSDSGSSEATDSSDSDDDKFANAAVRRAAPNRDSSDSSDSSESDSEDEDSESGEDNERAKANVATKAEVESSDEDSEEDSEDGDEDEENVEEEAEPPAKKRKVELEPASATKKTKTEGESNGRECNNLFVGNLSWHVDEEWLTREFDGFGEIIRVQLMTDRNSGRSKGFGFVQFKEVSAAIEAYNTKSGSVVDGRPMNVDYSPPKEGNYSNNSTPRDKYKERAERFGDKQNPPSDTVYVGNLSFDATPDMVRDVFEQYGEVTRCALPTDPESGNPKGFAYVGFTSVEDATKALNAMKGESIAGRPVRLDFATPRDGNNSSPRGGRGGFGNRGGPRGRGGFGGRGGVRGGRGGFGRGGGRGGSMNRGGFGDYKGSKVSFD